MENKYYLAIETNPKNYFPIDLLELNIFNGITTTKLNELDALTLKYTKEDIMKSIKDANLLEISENMPLVIIYYEKKDIRKIPALTSNIHFDLWAYLKENYGNKQLLNKIDNFLKNKIADDLYEKIKNSKNINEWILNINLLSYDIERKLFFYLYENELS